jgi:hypothetical protein
LVLIINSRSVLARLAEFAVPGALNGLMVPPGSFESWENLENASSLVAPEHYVLEIPAVR